jgi:hypothetical protein
MADPPDPEDGDEAAECRQQALGVTHRTLLDADPVQETALEIHGK